MAYIPPQWAFDLEREIMLPARQRLAQAQQELADAKQAEAAAFEAFRHEYNRRLSTNPLSARRDEF